MAKDYDKLYEVMKDLKDNYDIEEIGWIVRKLYYDFNDKEEYQHIFLNNMLRTCVDLFTQSANGRKFEDNYLKSYFSRY